MAFAGVVTRRVAGSRYTAAKKRDVRSLFLTVFHVASKLYRVAVACAIAALLIQYAALVGAANRSHHRGSNRRDAGGGQIHTLRGSCIGG